MRTLQLRLSQENNNILLQSAQCWRGTVLRMGHTLQAQLTELNGAASVATRLTVWRCLCLLLNHYAHPQSVGAASDRRIVGLVRVSTSSRWRTMALRRSNVRLICLSAFYVFFLLVGAAIFSAIEGPIEMKRLRRLLAIRHKFLENRQHCLSGQLYASILPYGMCFYWLIKWPACNNSLVWCLSSVCFMLRPIFRKLSRIEIGPVIIKDENENVRFGIRHQ